MEDHVPHWRMSGWASLRWTSWDGERSPEPNNESTFAWVLWAYCCYTPDIYSPERTRHRLSTDNHMEDLDNCIVLETRKTKQIAKTSSLTHFAMFESIQSRLHVQHVRYHAGPDKIFACKNMISGTKLVEWSFNLHSRLSKSCRCFVTPVLCLFAYIMLNIIATPMIAVTHVT